MNKTSEKLTCLIHRLAYERAEDPIFWEKGKVSLEKALEGLEKSFCEVRIGQSFLSARGGARISGHAQVIKNQTDVASELSHFLCNTAYAFGFDYPDGKAAEAGDVFRAIAGPYAAAIFIEIPVQDVMATVLDAPVAAIDGKELLCVSLLWGSTGDAVCDVV